MSQRIRAAFERAKQAGETAFVGYITAGFPTLEDTVPLLLAQQAGGAHVVELGIPFTDPLADGKTIQHANFVGLENGATLKKSFDLVAEARKQGLTIPVIFMGYYNPFLIHGLDQLCKDAVHYGVDGFIVVDLPPEEAQDMLSACNQYHRAFIPLIAPTTKAERIPGLVKIATGFAYCVSVTGVTGARESTSADLPTFLDLVRKNSSVPLAVGFGISKREHVEEIGKISDGVVVGSAIVKAAASADNTADRVQAVKSLIAGLTGRTADATPPPVFEADPAHAPDTIPTIPSGDWTESGTFGKFGGRYIPEMLAQAHEQLAEAYDTLKDDPAFKKELGDLLRDYVGRPTALYYAKNLSKELGGAEIWCKREDLAHTGAHKINNALGQGLLARHMGKPRIIAETGAGQHGVATATACALLGLKCTVYMGAVDVKRQSLNVFRMKMMGAEVVPVESGAATLKDAINEAMRDWVTNVRDTHYIIGSVVGPDPYPRIVRDFQAVIGEECRRQMLEQAGRLPDYAIACVGGGSNAMGLFHPFRNDKEVALIGVEAGGKDGISGLHSAPLSAGKPGVLHGAYSYLMQDEAGQIEETHSISAGLDYPGVGPEHSYFKDSGRAEYVVATDQDAIDAMQHLSRTEGIIPALESAHAVSYAIKLAKSLPKDKKVVVNISGRGDKDMIQVAAYLGVNLGLSEQFEAAHK